MGDTPPMHPNRMTAFVNHFLLSTCSFLNEFAGRCEEKFIIIERKMQKLEAALIILEAKIASIEHTDSVTEVDKPGDGSGVTSEAARPEPAAKSEAAESPTQSSKVETTEAIPVTTTATNLQTEESATESTTSTDNGVKACDDVRYKKFFKMLQFGVPMEAIKLKMKVEGAPPEILNTPNLILPDGVSS